MAPSQRLQIAIELSDLLREFRKAGIRRDHPDWSERQVMIELFRQAFFPSRFPHGCDEFRPSLSRALASSEPAQIAYMVVGSFASNLYGAGRANLDIDIVISATPDQTRAFFGGLLAGDYYFDMASALDAWKHRSKVVAATAEDVVISKLEWAQMGASSRQIEDVAGILRERRELLDLNYVERWVKDLGLAEQWAAAQSSAGLA